MASFVLPHIEHFFSKLPYKSMKKILFQEMKMISVSGDSFF